MMRRTTITAAGTTAMACAAALALSACGPSFEGSGSKDAASAEQLALREPDPWAEQVEVDPNARASEDLQDGVYTGSAPAMAGMVTVTLLVEDNHITCIALTQDGETQSVGGYESIRDGRYAAMIEAAQGSDIDVISGATITTAAVGNAVEDALDQARVVDADEASAADSVANPGADAEDAD